MENPSFTFAGIQKLTLLDYPDKTACTLFTQGCNFACPFCHNPSLIEFDKNAQGAVAAPQRESNPVRISCKEVLDFLETRQGLLDGVCISGGEPLVQEGLDEFVRSVKAMGFLVKIDTNGSYPDRLKVLVESLGIDYVAMDIKNTPEKYAATIGIAGYDLSQVMESIAYLLTGAVPYEFRTTVVREFHTADDLLSIARLIPGAKRYVLQGFESSREALQPGLTAYSKQEMEQIAGKVRNTLPFTELR